MLRGAKQFIAKAAARRVVSLILFSVGGKPFAMKAAEVRGVEPWPAAMPIPSTTPCAQAVVWRGQQVYGVYDLAREWALTADQREDLCLLVRWGGSEVAVQIDSQIPSLEMAEVDMIRGETDPKRGLMGHWTHQGREIPLVSFVNMEVHLRQAA